jgi:hypothetical protein
VAPNQASTIVSKNGVRIRLTAERWEHIAEEHGELASLASEVLRAIGEPEQIFTGGGGELLAVRQIEPSKWMVAVYREQEHDGFVITAFLTRRRAWLERRRRLFP